MKRLWTVGIGALWASVALADQPLSVYPPVNDPPRLLRVAADEAKAERAPAPSLSSAPAQPMAQPLSATPTVNYPTHSTWNHPGTTVPMNNHWAGAAAMPCGPSAPCASPPCVTCGIPCGTPLFSGFSRPGERPCLSRLSAWLGYRPGPRVIPTMIPNVVDQRPLYTYTTPMPRQNPCPSGGCQPMPTAPAIGFSLIAPTRPLGAIQPTNRLARLGFGSGCSTCTPACGTPLRPQMRTTGCASGNCSGTPAYLTAQAYPAAHYAPAPSLLSRIKNFFTPTRYGFDACGWTAPPAPCPTGYGPQMTGSSGTWNGTAVVPYQPTPMPQALPQAPMPQPMSPTATPTTSMVPGYRFATPLTQMGGRPEYAPQPSMNQTMPIVNRPFSNP